MVCPLPHCSQPCAGEALSGRAKPSLHAWQADAPESTAYLPAPHGVQTLAPGEAEKCPTGQGVQMLAPGEAEKCPAGQGVQLGWRVAPPVVLPALQTWHSDMPCAAKVLAGQSTQEPFKSGTVPASHSA